jgi:general secretion pathway protein A
MAEPSRIEETALEHLHHFGLSQDPFSNEPDLRSYFESASHRDAQRRVERGLRQHKGLTLLTGDGGMGKTLLARRVLEALEEEVFEATLLVMLPGAADATGILQRFARQLGVEEPAEARAGLIGQIYEQLAIVREDGRHAVLIVDDAQIMKPDALSELSGLLSLEYEDRRLVSMLLIGSNALDKLVQNDPGIAPRVEVRVRLQPLSNANTKAYILHRLTHVGGRPELIPAEALDTLYKLGRGRPRLLNTLADNALFEAYLAGRKTIDSNDIERAATDLGVGPDPGETFIAPTMSELSIEDAPELDLVSLTEPIEASMEFDPAAETSESDVLELSNAIFAPEPVLEVEPIKSPKPPAPAEPIESAEMEFESLSFESDPFGSDPLEMDLEEAEFSSDDAQELDGVFVELIEE